MHGKGIENKRCEWCVCCALYFLFTSLVVRWLQLLATFDYKCAVGPLQLVIRHRIIHAVHCVQVGEQEMYSKKTKKDWHHFKWYPSLFFCLFVCLIVFPILVSLLLFSNADLYHLKESFTSEKGFWVTHVILYSCQLYYLILKANCLYKETGHLAILIWWCQGRGIH